MLRSFIILPLLLLTAAPVRAQAVVLEKAPEGASATAQVLGDAIVRGEVVDEDGQPISGASVFLQTLDGKGSRYRPLRVDASGRFEATAERAGQMLLQVSERSGEHVGQEQRFDVRAREPKDLGKIVLRRGVLIEGVAIDEDGKPVKGVHVSCFGPREGNSRATSGGTSSADGRYKLRALPGQNTLSVHAPEGWIAPPEADSFGMWGAGFELKVTQGQSVRRDWILPRAASLHLQVLDGANKPVADATILYQQKTARSGYLRQITTDKKGIANIEGLHATPITLRPSGAWRLSGRDSMILQPQKIAPGSEKPLTTLRVRRAALASVKGRVVTDDGKPVAEAKITAYLQKENWQDDIEGIAPRRVTSDERGNFWLRDIAPGTKVIIESTREGFAAPADATIVQTRTATEVSARDIVMRSLSAKVQGRVVDASGTPVPRAQVLSPQSSQRTPIDCGADGSFVLGGLLEGRTQIFAIAPLAADSSRANLWGETVATGKDEVRIVLKPMAKDVARSVERARDIIGDLKASGRDFGGRGWMAFPLAARDLDVAFEMASDGAALLGAMRGELLARFAQSNPELAAMRAESEIAQIRDRKARMRAYAVVAPPLQASAPDVAARLWQRWQEEASEIEKTRKLDVWELFAGIEMIAAVDAASLPKYLEKVVAEGGQGEEMNWGAAVLLARHAPGEAAPILARMKGGALRTALHGAIEEAGAERARAMIPWLNKLESLRPGEEEEGFINPETAWAESAVSIVRGLADQAAIDPETRAENARLAIEILDKAKSRKGEMALHAARLLDREMAIKYLRESLDAEEDQGQFGVAPQMALAIYDLDPKAGHEVFEDQLANMNRVPAGKVSATGGAWFMALAAIDRPRARMLIERDWALLGREKMFEHERAYVLAMAACDFERAWAMSQELSLKQGNRDEAQLGLARFVLADAPTRRNASMRKWNRLNSREQD